MLVGLLRALSGGYLFSSAQDATSNPVQEVANQHIVRNPNHSPVKGATKKRDIVPIQALDDAKEAAKTVEWKITLEAMIKAFDAGYDATRLETAPESAHTYLQQRLCRIFNRPFGDETMVELAKTLTKDELCEQQVEEHLTREGLTLCTAQHAEEFHRELTSCFYARDGFKKEYALLESQIVAFKDLVLGSRDYLELDPESRAKAIWLMFRELLASPAYLLMRCDETQSYVSLLHTFDLGALAHAETGAAYFELGNAMQKAATIKRVNSLGNILISSREAAADAGFLENDPPEGFLTAVSQIAKLAPLAFRFLRANISLRQTVQAVRELAWAYWSANMYGQAKDYRVRDKNLPTVLYEEKFTNTKKKTSVAMRVIVSSSLAQGAKVHPEFLALFQALENRQHTPIVAEPIPFTHYLYINLQRRYEGNEGLQSDASMRINDRYPSSFKGYTIATDPLGGDVPFDEHVSQKMIDLLCSDQTFTLKKTTGKSKYYFPAEEREELEPVFREIVADAYKTVAENANIAQKQKTGLFQGLVNSGIIRHLKVKEAATLLAGRKNVKALTSVNCAVSTDRGPKELAKQMLFLGGEYNWIASFILARGPVDKGRLALEEAIMQLGDFAHDWSERDAFKKFFERRGARLLAKVNARSTGVTCPGYPQNCVNIAARRKITF